VIKTRKAAMTMTGLGSAVFLSIAHIGFSNPEVSLWERPCHSTKWLPGVAMYSPSSAFSSESCALSMVKRR
jgi:hypothetical protein